MADKQIVELPSVPAVTDDTLIPVYVPGSASLAQSMTGKQFREFGQAGVKDYVETAMEAAEIALAAAEQAQEAVEHVQGAADQAAAAEAANAAAQAAMEAALVAKTVAENAALNAADDAVQAAETELNGYVSAAQDAQTAAEAARDQAQAIAGGNFLPLSGGTMTGPISLSGNPTQDSHAANKGYIDEKIGEISEILDSINGEDA